MGEQVVMIPDRITAGASLSIAVTLTAYPAPDWALSLVMRGPTGIDLIAVPSGAQHRFTAEATTTAGWLPGRYWWQLRATRDGEVVQVDEGDLEVAPDLATISGEYDGRGHVERVLRAIEAVIEGRASIDQASYQINNRSLSRTPIPDLLLLRDKYRAELRRERQAARGRALLGRQVKVRF